MAQFGNRLIYSTAAAASADETVRSGIRLREREKAEKTRSRLIWSGKERTYRTHTYAGQSTHDDPMLCSRQK